MAFTFTTAAWTVRSLLIGAVLYSVAASNPSARAQSTPACSECDGSQSEHRLMGTYYDLQSFRASLIVNNKGPDPLPVSLTAYSLDGEPLELGALAMEGNSAEMLDLNEILESHPARFRQGSLELGYSYEGCPLVVSAGIVMQDEAAGVGSDELFARPPDFRSSRLEAVWWAPLVRARMQLALSNRSEETISAQIGVQSLGAIAEKRSMQVTLRPRETRTLNVPKALLIEGLGSAQWGSGSISIEHSGAPGQLTARGTIEDRAVRYSGVIEFSDPESGVSSRLHGTGLRVGSFKDQPLIPVVVLRNAADEPSQVTIRLPWSDDQGNTETAHVQTLILAAGEVREMNGQFLSALATIPDELVDSAGLEIEYSTAPGTVLAAAQAVAADGSRVFRLPLIDPDTKGSAGNYPWKLDQETATVVYLKNVTDRIQKYTAQVDFQGGAYVLGLNELQPGETFRLDLKELRDGQQPDQHGTVLPVDASSGQIHWSVIGTDNHSMIGRAEYVHQKTGLATTFACSSCCPDSYYNSWVTPPSAVFPFDASMQYSAYQQNQNCYGSLLSPFGVSGSWSSDNVNIIVMSSFTPGQADPVDTGYTIVIVVIQVLKWFFQGPSQGCVSEQLTAGGSGGGNVVRLVMTEPTASSGNLSISNVPAMPTAPVKARVLGWQGGTLTFDWKYKVSFSTPLWGKIEEEYPFSSTASGDNETSGLVQFGGDFYGGDVTVTVKTNVPGILHPLEVQRPNAYKILGTQPSATSVKNYVDSKMPPSVYWFAKRIAKHETDRPPTTGGYAQFDPNTGLPRMGDDQKGFGIFQLSPPSQDMQYWNWKANVDRAKVMLDAMESEATTFWNNQVLQFDLWNFDFPGDQKDPPADEPEGDITFSFDPTGGQKTFRDAIWIKRFNGASGGHYIVWRNTGEDANDPFWDFNKTNNLGFNYVNRICSTTP